MRVKTQLAEDLVVYLADQENSIIPNDLGLLIDSLMPWLTGSHYKVLYFIFHSVKLHLTNVMKWISTIKNDVTLYFQKRLVGRRAPLLNKLNDFEQLCWMIVRWKSNSCLSKWYFYYDIVYNRFSFDFFLFDSIKTYHWIFGKILEQTTLNYYFNLKKKYILEQYLFFLDFIPKF